jgi:hypothetical protein
MFLPLAQTGCRSRSITARRKATPTILPSGHARRALRKGSKARAFRRVIRKPQTLARAAIRGRARDMTSCHRLRGTRAPHGSPDCRSRRSGSCRPVRLSASTAHHRTSFRRARRGETPCWGRTDPSLILYTLRTSPKPIPIRSRAYHIRPRHSASFFRLHASCHCYCPQTIRYYRLCAPPCDTQSSSPRGRHIPIQLQSVNDTHSRPSLQML